MANKQVGDGAVLNGVTFGTSSNVNFYQNDPLTIYQQSVMATGFGAGNCWYYGRSMDATENNVHRFLCKNVGELASGSKLSLSFQFVISNIGKDMLNGYVSPLVDTMTCQLKANTFTISTSSETLWYEKIVTVNVDGGSQSKYRGYDGFFVTS